MKPLLPLILLAFLMPSCQPGDYQSYEFKIPGMAIHLNDSGEIDRLTYTDKQQIRNIKAFTRLAECETEGRIRVSRDNADISFEQKWVSRTTGNTCLVTNRFSPGKESIHWEIEIKGLKGTWSTPIETHFIYPDAGRAKIWTAWGDPRLGELGKQNAEEQAAKGILPSDITGNWSDPLVPIPFVNDTLWYGAPAYQYDNPRIGFMPFQRNIFSIPLVTLSEYEYDKGVSLIQSPADTLLDMNLVLSTSGELVFSREYHRISAGSSIRFNMDITAHEAGWQGGLRWMANHYPDYFNPNIPLADEIAGTGAYSSLETAFDKEKMKKMAFGVNWKASFDFPYMGMFIPPVTSDTTRWPRYGGGTTSIRDMRNYAAKMKSDGFHVLSYFNVTEFGANITDPAPPAATVPESDLWKNADNFLYGKLKSAILQVPSSVPKEKLSFYRKSRPNGPYFTWGDGIIVDPGEPEYADFLISQAKTHIDKITDAEGICIDRMDWLRMYNEQRDDGISWFGNQPTRSLLISWHTLLKRLGPLMHEAGKVIFINNHDKRIDLLRETDGFFDEFTYGGSPLNLTAFMGIRKPVLGWTSEEKNLKPDPDAFFQRYLYLGVYPMAPFPGNDHSLLPSTWVDQQYLDYGPMLQVLKGKKWILEPHALSVENGRAKANIFAVKGGWAIPVVFGPNEEPVNLTIKNVPGIATGLPAEIIYPGAEKSCSAELKGDTNAIRVKIPLKRGCAMLLIRNTGETR